MVRYRISKYNPKFRDEYGCYTKQEWTSISDVDKDINGVKVSLEEYLNTESRYIKALNNILNDLNIEYLYVMELEKQNDIINDNYTFEGFTTDMIETVNSIKEGQELDREKINYIIKAILREVFWCGLYSKTTHLIIKPGYDFYINIICPELSKCVIKNISELGLYIEEII
ncbi:hypothetical protein [Clostridium sporogenes]|uniref:hypothetical protein n=1 Tax=Clostridium sporogenes TaxID=1509 RepID=UPI0022386E75|nr:hypothetical protein [Clostridium sporogenes]EKS4344305.1 hypothetical protein [Clostridium botulinum]EKS4394183.1 hypothetical protein [Clostridium botulinum]MCW6080232.1 hypothetical protein [Clostridium sporogenes]